MVLTLTNGLISPLWSDAARAQMSLEAPSPEGTLDTEVWTTTPVPTPDVVVQAPVHEARTQQRPTVSIAGKPRAVTHSTRKPPVVLLDKPPVVRAAVVEAPSVVRTVAPPVIKTTVAPPPPRRAVLPPKPPPPPPVVANGNVVAAARAVMSLHPPYVYGGKTTAGADCSGFVWLVLKRAGFNIAYRSSGALYAWTRRITKAQLQPGDLVFWYSPVSHVGIYVGNGMVIDSGGPPGPVQRAIYPGVSGYGRLP